MKSLSQCMVDCALNRVRKTNRTVFINRTVYPDMEVFAREWVPDDFDFDDFRTVLYMDWNKKEQVLQLSSAVPDFKMELIHVEPEGNGIFDCEYRINDTQTVHLWHDDFYLLQCTKSDKPLRNYEKEILPLDSFGPFAQNLHLYYDRWEIWSIIFVPDCDIISDEILIDTSQCKAYGHMEGHDLYITTAASKFILPEDMSYAFHGLTRLSEIWGLENLDTSRVTNMKSMFHDAPLRNIDVSNFDTSHITTMVSMFEGFGRCDYSIHYPEENILDLTNFYTGSVESMENLFYESELDRILIGDWSFDAITDDFLDWSDYPERIDLSRLSPKNLARLRVLRA